MGEEDSHRRAWTGRGRMRHGRRRPSGVEETAAAGRGHGGDGRRRPPGSILAAWWCNLVWGEDLSPLSLYLSDVKDKMVCVLCG